jgi:malonate transporter
MPVVAWLLGVALDLHETVLLGVVITAALPTAQNIFLHATRYRVGEDVARESILVTTLCSLPIALVIALLLG